MTIDRRQNILEDKQVIFTVTFSFFYFLTKLRFFCNHSVVLHIHDNDDLATLTINVGDKLPPTISGVTEHTATKFQWIPGWHYSQGSPGFPPALVLRLQYIFGGQSFCMWSWHERVIGRRCVLEIQDGGRITGSRLLSPGL